MLGSFFLPYHTARYNKKKNIRRFSCSFEEATAIGLVCSYRSLIGDKVIDQFVERLKQSGKKVTLLVFHENSNSTEGLSNNSFSKRDLSFFGFWKKERVKNFISKEFNFLLYLDLSYNEFTSNVIAQSKAHCRIGVFDDDPKPFLELIVKYVEENDIITASDVLVDCSSGFFNTSTVICLWRYP